MPSSSTNWRHRRQISARKYLLKAQYGITLDDYEELLNRQGGGCGICKAKPKARKRSLMPILFVDHNHTTGEVRGLLCPSCNNAIGLLRDKPELCLAAAAYLSFDKML